jgi:ribonuclease HIII
MPINLKNTNPEAATSYVCELDETQRLKLETVLREKGWSFVSLPHAFWKASHAKTNATAYMSGKLVVQGRGTGELVLYIIEPEITGNAILGYEEERMEKKEEEPFKPHAGIDESGKGDIFGSLSIAAVFVDEDTYPRLKKIGVRDSKSIKSDAKIASMAREIKKIVGENYSVVSIGPEAYNRLYDKFANLNKLLAWGHSRALENLLEKNPKITCAISDKFAHESLVRNALLNKGRKIKLTQRTKAESDIAVAAASILARNAFVETISSLSAKLGFTIPKGAGNEVKKALKKIIDSEGADFLSRVSKLHFKTVKESLGISSDDRNEELDIR